MYSQAAKAAGVAPSDAAMHKKHQSNHQMAMHAKADKGEDDMREAIEPGETVLQMPTNIVEIESRIDYLIG